VRCVVVDVCTCLSLPRISVMGISFDVECGPNINCFGIPV